MNLKCHNAHGAKNPNHYSPIYFQKELNMKVQIARKNNDTFINNFLLLKGKEKCQKKMIF